MATPLSDGIWGRPPFPQGGDQYPDLIFRVVGLALSQWEAVEIELSGLFAQFKKLPRTSVEAREAYKAGRIFTERANCVTEAACDHFRSAPDQNLESNWDALKTEAHNASSRRNDIAHGIVQLFEVLYDEGENFGTILYADYCLAPPRYDARRIELTNRPEYSMNSGQIIVIGRQFRGFAQEVWAYSEQIRFQQLALQKSALIARGVELPFHLKDPTALPILPPLLPPWTE